MFNLMNSLSVIRNITLVMETIHLIIVKKDLLERFARVVINLGFFGKINMLCLVYIQILNVLNAQTYKNNKYSSLFS